MLPINNSVQTWPEEIPLSEESRHRDLLDTVDRYEQWASERGLSLRPPFETRTSSLLIGRSKEVLRLPMIAILYDLSADSTREWKISNIPSQNGRLFYTLDHF